VADNLETELLAQIPVAWVKDDYAGGGIYAIHDELGIAYLGLANKILKVY